MSLVVNNNIASLIAQRNLSVNSNNLTKSFEKLSSGYRINRASDDAAGLSISERLRGQIRGYNQENKNIQDGINMLQIAEGGLSVISDNLQRIRELCVQAANGTNATTEKSAIINEITQRLNDINRIAKTAKFNNTSLLDGSSTSLILQIGANTLASTNTITLSDALPNAKVTNLSINMTTAPADWNDTAIRTYLDSIDAAMNTIVEKRSTIGAYQNRLESAFENLTIMTENLQASESRIRDVDIAKEAANMTKNQILQKASASVLMQANQMPQLALSLLQ
jgi:flagellin